MTIDHEPTIREAVGFLLRFLPRWMDAEDLYQVARLTVWKAERNGRQLRQSEAYTFAKRAAITALHLAYHRKSINDKYAIESRMLSLDSVVNADGFSIADFIADPYADTEAAALSLVGLSELFALCKKDRQRVALALLIYERPYTEIAGAIGIDPFGITKLLHVLAGKLRKSDSENPDFAP